LGDSVDWVYAASAAPASYATGHGNVSFALTDLREPAGCAFRYYRVGGELQAQSATVHFRAGEPTHGHLALTGDATQMLAAWVSNVAPANGSVATVQYGQSPTALSSSANATTSTYKASDMCGPPANRSITDGGGFISKSALAVVAKCHYFACFGVSDATCPLLYQY